MAERSTFSTAGAMRLLVACKIVMASPALRPRMRSTTRRIFWADMRTYRASALYALISAASAMASLPSSRALGRLGGLVRLCRVSFKRAGGGELAEFVTHHIFSDVHRDKLSAVVDGEGVTDEFGKNG